MSLVPISKSKTMSPVAKKVYDTIMSLPKDAAQVYAAMVVTAGLNHDMTVHREIIQKRVDEIVGEEISKIQRTLSRTFISKARDGKDITAIRAASAVISKDFDPDDYPGWERSRNAERQKRGEGGRFVTQNRKIHYTKTDNPLPRNYAASHLGVPNDKDTYKGIKGADMAAFQQAYSQVGDMLTGFTGVPAGDGFLHLTYEDKANKKTTEFRDIPSKVANGRHEDVGVDAAKFEGGGRLIDASVVLNPGISVQGAAFDLVGALSHPGSGAANIAGETMRQTDKGVYDGAKGLHDFADKWHERDNPADQFNPSNRVFRRMKVGSMILNSPIGPHLPDKAKFALGAADFVGQYGPEAQRVIGPTADRAAYRYRGVEKTPDPMLQANIEAFRKTYPTDEEARNALIYGGDRTTFTPRRPGEPIRSVHEDSPLIKYFEGRLPDSELINLQASSGVIPPSQGIIIDRHGKVVTEAVGYGDDWYLPFNLKNLGKLKGGEYIRTRTWGGPTTEDIYTGLMSGARSVTVISHNGIYTIEFDDSFRGSRRYNDKAARMVGRYGHLLDAVKSKEVTLGSIPPERKQELREKVAQRGISEERNPDLFKTKYDELVAFEERHPTMPKSAREEVAQNVLAAQAEKTSTVDGRYLDPSQQAADYVDKQVAREKFLYSASPLSQLEPFNESAVREQTRERVNTPSKLIFALELDKEYQMALTDAEAEYRAVHSPLHLDGSGYDKAQVALKEQFPYYIKSVKWQEKKRGREDVGYIKPRHNRPAGVLAGYFDHSITGAGKVDADRTRYQNGRQGRDFAAARSKDESAANRNKPLGVGSNPVTGSNQDNLSEAGKMVKRREAVDAMVRALHGKKTYSNYTVNPATRGQPVTREGLAAAGLESFKYASPDDVMSAWDKDPASARNIEAMVDRDWIKARDGKILDLESDEPLRQAVRDPEAASRGKEFSLTRGLAAPGDTYDFPGLGPNQTPEVIADAVAPALVDLKINGLDDPKFEEKIAAHTTRARTAAKYIDSPGLDMPEDELTVLVKNIAMAKQGKRRYIVANIEKTKREDYEKKLAVEAPKEEPGGANIFFVDGNKMTPIGYNPGTPAEYAEEQRRKAAGGSSIADGASDFLRNF